MEFISGPTHHLPEKTPYNLARYRFQVFVEELGWKLDTNNGIELDQFDRPDTQYIVARDEYEQIIGCARLLPTTKPYLLEEVFPQLLNGKKPPKSEEVWELSRFTALNLNNQDSIQPNQLSSKSTLQLLDKVIEYAKQHGAKRLISVSPIGVERLLRNTKYHTHRAGPPMVIDGHPLIACWIYLDEHQ